MSAQGSDRLTPELVMHAYRSGIFPMAEHRQDDTLFWVDPRRRGVFPLNGFHISRSLKRRLLTTPHYVTINADFAGVMQACADRSETWINDEIESVFNALHHLGHAHSIEVWSEERLIGGVYGLAVGAVFCGESMFSRATDGSKMALAYLVDRLNRGGFQVFDTQFLTPHLASLGAIEVPRSQYHSMLREAMDQPASFTAPAVTTPQDVLHRNTQTS